MASRRSTKDGASAAAQPTKRRKTDDAALAADDASQPAAKRAKTGGDESLTTLHVSGLGALDSAGLSDLFSAVGPIKSAFVVTEQPSGTSRGFGFVRFALAEDAQAAIDRFATHKTITTTWARRRQRDGVVVDSDKPKPAPKPAPKPKRVVSAPAPTQRPPITADDRRAIILYGLGESSAPDALKKGLYKKAKKLLATMPGLDGGGDLAVEYPVDQDGQPVGA